MEFATLQLLDLMVMGARDGLLLFLSFLSSLQIRLHRFCMLLLFISLCPKKRNKERLSWLNSQTSAWGVYARYGFAYALGLYALLKVVVASSASNRTHDGDGVASPRSLRR